ncbi:MAG: hypothetical protein LAO06_15690 [Acidobacteriia bacterium]|nr:hypothetical protein [Terriglobia bacterium]
MRHYGLLFLILLACTSSLAQFPLGGAARQSDASRTVVDDYCRMDYAGSRLAKDTWPRMKPLTAWKENPDWNGFTIVSQYDILDAADGLRSAAVRVQYAVLGRFQIRLGYLAEPGREEVSFRLKKMDGAWKIEDQDPAINPHVSKARAIAWLKSSLVAEKDAANKITLEKALQELGAKP